MASRKQRRFCSKVLGVPGNHLGADNSGGVPAWVVVRHRELVVVLPATCDDGVHQDVPTVEQLLGLSAKQRDVGPHLVQVRKLAARSAGAA